MGEVYGLREALSTRPSMWSALLTLSRNVPEKDSSTQKMITNNDMEKTLCVNLCIGQAYQLIQHVETGHGTIYQNVMGGLYCQYSFLDLVQ